MQDNSHDGGCLCGAIRYKIFAPLPDVVCCHCSQCRKQTGLYYATVEVPIESFFISGEEHLKCYRSSETAQRQFCNVCGSALFWLKDGQQTIDVLAGSLDHTAGIKIDKHIHVEDKGDFYPDPENNKPLLQ